MTHATDYEAIERDLRALSSDIGRASMRVQDAAENARARIENVTFELGIAVLAEQLGTGTAERVAELRQERKSLRDTVENAELIGPAVERANAVHMLRTRNLHRARSRGESFELDLPNFLDRSE